MKQFIILVTLITFLTSCGGTIESVPTVDSTIVDTAAVDTAKFDTTVTVKDSVKVNTTK